MPPTSYKTAVLARFLAVFACGPCAGAVTAPVVPISSNNSHQHPVVREFGSENANNRCLDHDWLALAQSKPPKKDDQKKSSGSPSGGGGGGGKKDDSSTAKKPAANQPSSEWVLVLGTYSEDSHDQAARTMLSELRRIAPDVARYARVHVGSKGSMVVYGHYTSREDPKAKDDQEQLKKVMFQNRPLFNRVIVSRIDNRTMESQFDPHDLLSVRQKFPKVDPLYTVDIAIWDDLGSGKMKYEEIRKKAEAYCTELRSRGVEAYFYHDDENQRSTVTVGVFDRRAINSTSGLFSPEVEAVMKKFPARLVNGEPLYEFKDKHHQDRGVKPQPPRLSLVPEL